jgi:hypothetical protein
MMPQLREIRGYEAAPEDPGPVGLYSGVRSLLQGHPFPVGGAVQRVDSRVVVVLDVHVGFAFVVEEHRHGRQRRPKVLRHTESPCPRCGYATRYKQSGPMRCACPNPLPTGPPLRFAPRYADGRSRRSGTTQGITGNTP